MVSPPTILFADKETDGLAAVSNKLNLPFNCSIEHVFTEQDLEESLQNNSIAILAIDLHFGDTDNELTLLSSLKEKHPNTVILPIIPAGQPQLIKQVLDLDLFYFVHRPIDPGETALALKRAYESLPPDAKKPKVVSKPKHVPFHGMIGSSPQVRQLFDLISRVAEDDISTVLIRGESGTGKEMVAKAIHAQSKRFDKNFVPVNCAAIPDDLLESELFGYTKGAFTGATTNKPGRIQYADQGTLFLDEIGDMKSALQAKLLRVIQEKEFEPVGAFKSIPVNTRILAATHCDLEQLVSEGRFREDLYYRLSVVPLHIPSLKERIEDIPLLIDAFFEKYADKRERERFSFSSQAFAAISHYEWRGNVRELENLIQHMTILYSGRQVELTDLPEKFHSVTIPPDYQPTVSADSSDEDSKTPQSQQAVVQNDTWENGTVDFNELISDFETQLILKALKLTEGNKKEAARLLNLKRTTLLEKIKKKDIDGSWDK
ncbi:MAG: sigma-54 dependent transcriptional regulator [Desulforhopalus sp.]